MGAIITNYPLKPLICPFYNFLLFLLNNLLQVSISEIIVMKSKIRGGGRKEWKHNGKGKET